MVFLMHRRESKSGAYYLKTEEGGVAHTYCHMEDIPECGGKGWTLVMKINGKKVGNSPFDGYLSSSALQCNPTWMRGNIGQKLQNCPKLPHIHVGLYTKEN